MATQDKQGRKYARLIDLKVGDKLDIDDGFDCMSKKRKHTVRADGRRLYVGCADGRHFLDGQDDGDGHLVGMYKV